MRYEWELKDIISGRVVRNNNTKALNNKAMICGHVDKLFSLVSLTDGFMIVSSIPIQLMEKTLNGCNYEPTDDDRETTRAIDYLRGVR